MQPNTVSWVPQEWPGPARKLRAWISSNRGPSPWEGGEILALSPKEFYPPPPQPAAPAASLSLDRERDGRRRLCPAAALLFGCVWALLGKSKPWARSVSGSWMSSWCPPCPVDFPCVHCQHVRQSRHCPALPARLRISGLHTVSVLFSLSVWMYCSV